MNSHTPTEAPAASTYERREIGGTTVLLPRPIPLAVSAPLGRDEELLQMLAALEARCSPLLVGPPGTGKTTACYHLASELGMELYAMHCHPEMLPGDWVGGARLSPTGEIEYVLSPLVAAMIRGGLLMISEIGKAGSRALAPLASLLDDQRALFSELTGVTYLAHPSFRCLATMNDDDPALPSFLGGERLGPRIRFEYPGAAAMKQLIDREGLLLPGIFLTEARNYLMRCEGLSTRVVISLLRYGGRLFAQSGQTPEDARQAVKICAAQLLNTPAPKL